MRSLRTPQSPRTMKTRASRSSAEFLYGLISLPCFRAAESAFPDRLVSQATPFSSMPCGQCHVVLAGDLQPVDDQGRCVRRGVFAEAGEPAPAAVGELHVGKPLDAGSGHLGDFGLVEDRVVLVSLGLLSSVARVAKLLGVQVGVLLANRLQIEARG